MFCFASFVCTLQCCMSLARAVAVEVSHALLCLWIMFDPFFDLFVRSFILSWFRLLRFVYGWLRECKRFWCESTTWIKWICSSSFFIKCSSVACSHLKKCVAICTWRSLLCCQCVKLSHTCRRIVVVVVVVFTFMVERAREWAKMRLSQINETRAHLSILMLAYAVRVQATNEKSKRSRIHFECTHRNKGKREKSKINTRKLCRSIIRHTNTIFVCWFFFFDEIIISQ